MIDAYCQRGNYFFPRGCLDPSRVDAATIRRSDFIVHARFDVLKIKTKHYVHEILECMCFSPLLDLYLVAPYYVGFYRRAHAPVAAASCPTLGQIFGVGIKGCSTVLYIVSNFQIK